MQEPHIVTVRGDVVTVYVYWDTRGRLLQAVALLRVGHNPCQRREMTVSTNNGLVNGPVHNLLKQVFTPGDSEWVEGSSAPHNHEWGGCVG